MDRKLADDYQAASHQAGIDAKKLQAEEAQWLREIRNPCLTDVCLRQAYRARDEAVLDASLRAASPAAYEDTRAFAAPSSAVLAARAHIGTNCEGAPAQPMSGTTMIGGFHPIVARGGYVVPLTVDGYPFAFWLAQSELNSSQCTVRDVVALPPPVPGNRFMQCHSRDDSYGFAVRSRKGETLAYWSIAMDRESLRREPIHVIGEQDLRCQEPETGE